MMNEYKTVKLGNVLNIQSSSRIFEREYVSEGIPFYRSKEIIEKHKGNDVSTSLFISEERFNKIKQAYSVPRDGDILLTSVGTIGIPYLVRENERFYFKDGNLTWFNNFSDQINNQYFYYWLLSEAGKEALNSILIGTTQKALTIKDLKTLELSLPPLPEQHRISNILSSFDNKIELLRKENNILEDIAQSIFKEWFVKYNFPNKDGKPYRDNNGKMIDSELGLIPEGWRVVSLTDIADFVNGLPMQKYRPKEGEAFLPVIKIKELNSGYSKDTEKARADLDEKYVVKPGEVVFSWSGSIGMDIWRYSKGALNQHLFKVTSKDYPKWFYYYWIKHYLPEFKQIAEGKATTMGHIQRGHLISALVAIPREFQNIPTITETFNKSIELSKEIETLSKAKSILLTKLI